MSKQYFEGKLIEKKRVAQDTYLFKFKANKKISPKAGQFFLVSKKNSAYFLKRPFSLHYFYDDGYFFKLLIRKKGKGTIELINSNLTDLFEFIGPLGNGFPLVDNKNVAIIAGGIGYAPFMDLIKELLKQGNEIDVYYGEKNKSYIVEYCRIKGPRYFLYTDDGSIGIKGNPIEHFKDNDYDRIYLCGPEIMYKNYIDNFKSLLNKSFASFERKMACGIGACKGCSILVDNKIKYVCKDGPVFKLSEVDFD